MPSPDLAPYAATKAAIANFCASLAQMFRLIPASMPPEKVEHFGEDMPLGRPGRPAELAGAYVPPASDEGSYMSGARVAVTGGRPIL